MVIKHCALMKKRLWSHDIMVNQIRSVHIIDTKTHTNITKTMSFMESHCERSVWLSF